jgi:hypothetical protein
MCRRVFIPGTPGGQTVFGLQIKERLKKLEVYAEGKSIYKWEPSEPGEIPFLSVFAELPYVIVLSKNKMILWGWEFLQTVEGTLTAVRLDDADMVVAEWRDGSIEVRTDDGTRTFNSRDEWPGEIDT